jgi:hypothetical protein
MKSSVLLAFVFVSVLQAQMAQPVSLRLAPEGTITVWGEQGAQQFVVLARYSDGMERDVTAGARLTLSDPEKGQIDKSGKFASKANGDVRLTAQFMGRQAEATIRVQGAGEQRPFSFARDIGAILTKRGCNNSDCHGGVKGKGGFKLSVGAQFPKDDYRWIVDGGIFQVLTADTGTKTPRINLKDPAKSLLLLKPSAQIAHGGGERIKLGSPDYEKMLQWIRAGAPYGTESAEGVVRIERVEVFPKDAVLDLGGRQQLLVTAYYSNGRREDITDQVLYISNNPSVIEVDENGVINAKKTGETAVLIRAAGRAVSASVGVIEKPIANYPVIEPRNYIDEFVFAKLRKFNIVPSELSSDAEFLRRICLDLTGTLPPPERVRGFLADGNPHKREELIERLLNSPEYVDFWSFRFGDLLRTNYNTLQDLKATKAYEDWIIDSVASNKPFDQVARERIAAQGYAAPSRNFYYVTEILRPEIVMPEMVRVFWGRRIECAQCHNHPFESWSQDQFWGLAAFFSGVTELQGSRVIIDALGGGHVDQPKDMLLVHPRTKEKVVPAFLDGTKLPREQWMDPREKLAVWMTAQPYFAEATVNRMWSYFFGSGIVDPVDDFRSTNPPTNPELLRALAEDFAHSGYDLKRLMRTITLSRTYQLSATPNETNREDRINYSHAQPRALEAAVLLDAVSSATGVPEPFKYHPSAEGEPPPGARAVQMLPELTPSHFLDAFGRSMHSALPVGHPEPNLPQALHMFAGPTYTNKISQEGGRLDRLLRKGASDGEILDDFYLAALTRLPDPDERRELLAFLAARPTRRKEDLDRLVWAILSSREFAYNH